MKEKVFAPILEHLSLAGLVALLCLSSCGQRTDSGPSPPLKPEEAIQTFVLADPDLHIELVAAEPLVQDPVAITFDAAGRLWVVEMLSFMQDIDGTGEAERIGRVSVLFDDDGDGQMDRRTTFLDSLLLPRAIGLVAGGALVAENIPLWYAEDTDGDFVADRKSLVDATYGGIGMPEHSANGLWHGLDNWIYNAKSKYRYRRKEGSWQKEETEFRGQWGIAHDNAGRLFYNYNWSQLHADLVPPNSLSNNKNHKPGSGIDHGLTLDRKIFPIRSNRAVNRGYVPGTLDEEGKLLEFASACGPLIFRGTALPESYTGDAFVCEPTANLIKQNNVQEQGFMLSASAVYPDREFLASTDERFRPVSLASGPDGALYVVDMYKGIIQHGPYMTEYLRNISLERQLDRPIHMGRIWRITARKHQDSIPLNLENLETTELVASLESNNGWTRDTAQRLLVQQKDTMAIPLLEEMVRSGPPLGQLHALWTLEGLGVQKTEAYWPGLESHDPAVSQSALRILAARARSDKELSAGLSAFILNRYETAGPLLRMQMALETHIMPQNQAFNILDQFLETYGELPVARDVAMSSLEGREMAYFTHLSKQGSDSLTAQKDEIFMELLVAATTNSRDKEAIKKLLALVSGVATANSLRETLVHGMLNATQLTDSTALELPKRPELFREKPGPPDALIARLARRFTWPGKPEPEKEAVSESFDLDPAVMAQGRQQFLNLCANCHGTQGEGMPRFAPPLQGSEWVNGADYKLIMILLHGMEGPIHVNGKIYDIPDILPSMPSFSTLQDRDIAAIATYIRNAWGHANPQIVSGKVGGIRFRTQGKIQPWTASELDTLSFTLE